MRGEEGCRPERGGIAMNAFRLVRTHGPTHHYAVVMGPPGEAYERECAVCAGRIVSGDHVLVTERAGVVHAVAHAPDCVGALMRDGAKAGEVAR